MSEKTIEEEFIVWARAAKPDWEAGRGGNGELIELEGLASELTAACGDETFPVLIDFSDDRASAEALVLLVQELGRLGYLNIQFDDWGAPAADRIKLMATRTDDDQIHREGPTIIAAIARALMRAWEAKK